MSPQTVAALGERALIDRLRRRAPGDPPWLLVGIGDDAAVLEPPRGEVEVATTDGLIEDIHFRRAWTPADAIGHKALAVNLSDLAAMGARPRACLLSLSLPADFPLADFDALTDGLLELARRTGTTLVGGNLSRSPGPLIVDVTLLGSARRRRILTRRGGRPGHELFVSGRLGGAATGLALLQAGVGRADASRAELACLERYERPVPRVRLGSSVARQGAASAAIDLSDGLAVGIRQLAEASGTGAVIDAAALPVDPGTAEHAARLGRDPSDLALAGGDDYELLFAVPPRKRRAFLAAARRSGDAPVTPVGRLTAGSAVSVEREGQVSSLEAAGFDHFAGGK